MLHESRKQKGEKQGQEDTSGESRDDDNEIAEECA